MPEYPRSPFEKTGTSITPNVDGDVLNATVIGEDTPADGSFTTLKASTDPVSAEGVGDRGFNDARYALESNNLSDLDDAATAFDNIKQVATDSVTGVSELATDAETVTGTATNRVATPANITAKMAAPGSIGETTPASAEFTNIGVGIPNVTGTQLTLKQEDDAITPTLAFGDGDSGFYESIDDKICISIEGVSTWEFSLYTMGGNSSGKGVIRNEVATAIQPGFYFYGDPNTGMGYAGNDALSIIAGGVEAHRMTESGGLITHELTGTVQGDLLNNQMVQKATFDILGLMTDPRFLNIQCEDPGAGTMVDVSGQGNDGTYQGSMTTGDRVKSGMGWTLDFDGADDYVNLGDHNNFSFGDGTNDEAVTWFGVFEVINSGGYDIVSKWDSTSGLQLREYIIYINSSEQVVCRLYDESANIICSRITDSGISTGLHSIVVTYDGTGGATATYGITIYVDGVEIASTATNNASYVAMENLSTPLWIGAEKGPAGTALALIEGDLALFGIDGSEWSAYDVHRFHQLCKGLYGI